MKQKPNKPITPLQRILKERGLTQKVVADMTGLSAPPISQACRGIMTLETRRRIASALGVSEEEL